MDMNYEKLSLYSDKSDEIPHAATSIFLKKQYSPVQYDKKDIEIKCQTLYALKLYAQLIDMLKYFGLCVKKFKMLNEFTFCAHRFNF